MKEGAQKRVGFTIIEVSLVLAIAGLIFMMVFIAFPTLQRNQRDTKRREDLSEFATAIQTYQLNNRGALPTTGDTATSVTGSSSIYSDTTLARNSWAGFYRDYLPNPFTDPAGTPYSLTAVNCGATVGVTCNNAAAMSAIEGLSTEAGKYTIVVLAKATCDRENAVGVNNPRKLAILYKLEGGGIYCNSI